MHRCPLCRIDMVPVKVTGEHGLVFTVEQCPRCGGTWFDKYELYRVTDADVAVLDPLDERALGLGAPPPAEPLRCPKDGTPLALFEDMNFPRDLIVEQCGACGGLWFNRGELRHFRADVDARRPVTVGDRRRDHDPKAALTQAFMELDDRRAQHDREDRMVHTAVADAVRSFVSFLLTRPGPVAPAGWLVALGLLLYKVARAGESAGTVHVDMNEFRELLARQEEGAPATGRMP